MHFRNAVVKIFSMFVFLTNWLIICILAVIEILRKSNWDIFPVAAIEKTYIILKSWIGLKETRSLKINIYMYKNMFLREGERINIWPPTIYYIKFLIDKLAFNIFYLYPKCVQENHCKSSLKNKMFLMNFEL